MLNCGLKSFLHSNQLGGVGPLFCSYMGVFRSTFQQEILAMVQCHLLPATTEALGPIIRKSEDSKFHPPARLPTGHEKKVILFQAVQHGIYAVMKSHTYR